MGRVTTIITGDASQLTAEQRKVAEAAKKMSDEFTQVDRSIRQMGREADKTLRDTRTSQERYNAQIEKLGTLLKHNKIDQDTYNRAVQKATDAYQDADRSSRRAFGESFSGRITTAIASLTGLLSVSQLIRDTFAAVRQEADELGQVLDDRFGTLGEIGAAASSREEFRLMKRISSDMLRMGAATSFPEADRIAVALKSAGQLGEAETAGKVARTGLTQNLEDLIKNVTSLQSAFEGFDPTGNMAAMISKAFIAGDPALQSPDEILRAAARAGGLAGSTGVTDEELMAAIAILGRGNVTTERAATLVENVIKKAATLGLGGGGFADIIPRLEQAIKTSGESPVQFLQDIQAVQGFESLRANMGQIQDLTKQIVAGNTGQVLQEKLQLMEAENQSTILKRQSLGRLLATKGETGIAELEQVRDAITAEAENMRVLAGTHPKIEAMFRRRRKFLTDWGISENELSPSGAAAMQQYATQTGNQALLESVQELIRLQRRATELSEIREQREERNERGGSRNQPAPRIPRPETN